MNFTILRLSKNKTYSDHQLIIVGEGKNSTMHMTITYNRKQAIISSLQVEQGTERHHNCHIYIKGSLADCKQWVNSQSSTLLHTDVKHAILLFMEILSGLVYYTIVPQYGQTSNKAQGAFLNISNIGSTYNSTQQSVQLYIDEDMNPIRVVVPIATLTKKTCSRKRIRILLSRCTFVVMADHKFVELVIKHTVGILTQNVN